MHKVPLHVKNALNQRLENGSLRNLRPQRTGIDFYSNDYLGLARNQDLQAQLMAQVSENPQLLSGSTGSRLISGNTAIISSTEQFIAETHQYEAALLFYSGYNANLALISALPSRHDTVIVDENIHRSVHDACKMTHAKKLKFKHNNPEHLEALLKKQSGHCYVAIESLYSMDGDFAPICEIARITEKYNASLIVDEAHAFVVFGYGLVHKFQLQHKVLATVVTYGKALGTHGAAILTTHKIKSYLINFASPFIYSTAAHDFLWMSIQTGYLFLKQNPGIARSLQENIALFGKLYSGFAFTETSPIQPIIIPDQRLLKTLMHVLENEDFLTYAVLSPTVKPGTERLRICLHSFNTEDEISRLCNIIRNFI